ncbi:MAG TPA: TlpA disulfide reductase family protein [Gemmatimonadaceae bacterium]
MRVGKQFCFGIALSLVAPIGVMRAQDGGPPLGSIPPSATLQTLDGKPVELTQIAKGPAVVEFWATWCENCAELLPAMQRAHATYGNRVTFVAVAVAINQSVQRVKLHVEKHKVPGEQLFDAKGDATDKWNVPATSFVVVLDRAGKVVYTGVGGDQNIDAAVRKALN